MAKSAQQPTLIKYGDVDKAVADGMDKAFLEIAIRTVTLAKASVPVDFGVLGASIMSKGPLDPAYGLGSPATSESGRGGGGVPPGLSTQVSGHEVVVGSAVEYALYQEFGTRRMAAQPYLRPAIQIAVGHGKASEVIAKYNSDEVKNAVKNKTRGKKVKL